MTSGWILFFVAVAMAAVLALLGAVWLVRALINSRESGPPAWWAVLLAAAVLLAVPVAAVATYLLLPVPLTEGTLTQSIERETHSAGFSSECSKREERSWRCSIDDTSGSGVAQYDVTAGRSCWDASRRGGDAETPMPARPEGCTALRDVLGISD
jgi:hypothetical protein